ncbi:MAG TPA: GspH/FimT family pseudopilin [Thermoanaerobaculia bacterium]|nr:GspH/FimT family pseudopilin [Thermoanaerobaculia bacterium]
MTFVPTRDRRRGPGLSSGSGGLSSLELVVVMALVSALAAATARGAFDLQSALAVRSAAGEVASAFLRARAFAITRGVNVGLKFRKDGGRYEWALYRDGNRNGIRTAEITSGVDRSLGLAVVWPRNDVRPGILPNGYVPDPSAPGQILDRPDDPIRFGNSDICSFSPVGESTPGSVYLWDGHDRMAVVRVFGRSAKVRTLYYFRGEKTWRK